MIPASFGYERPASLAEALSILAGAGEGTKVIGGGQSLLPLLKLRMAEVDRLVDISRLAELRGIRAGDGGGLVIGGGVPYAEVLASALVAERCPLLVEVIHDIGDVLAPHTHGEMVAAILKPYVREEVCWIVRHHGLFQRWYYAHHYDEDRNGRDRYRDSPWFDGCVEFCERYDQNCFDPEFRSRPLEFFEPMVRRVFAEARYLGPEVPAEAELVLNRMVERAPEARFPSLSEAYAAFLTDVRRARM